MSGGHLISRLNFADQLLGNLRRKMGSLPLSDLLLRWVGTSLRHIRTWLRRGPIGTALALARMTLSHFAASTLFARPSLLLVLLSSILLKNAKVHSDTKTGGGLLTEHGGHE